MIERIIQVAHMFFFFLKEVAHMLKGNKESITRHYLIKGQMSVFKARYFTLRQNRNLLFRYFCFFPRPPRVRNACHPHAISITLFTRPYTLLF